MHQSSKKLNQKLNL